MRCPSCGGEKTKTVDSRLVTSGADAGLRWRRRRCLDCEQEIITYEVRLEEWKAAKRASRVIGSGSLLKRFREAMQHMTSMADEVEKQIGGGRQ